MDSRVIVKMGSEIRNKEFLLFFVRVIIGLLLSIGLVFSVNTLVDSSQILNVGLYSQMAVLALQGNTVANPDNYDERAYQVAVVKEMNHEPDAIVVGSSRGMFLGKDITGYSDIYNHCVSGAIIEDYYAVLGLYDQKFDRVPATVIIEASPWIFYGNVPESRWMENYEYAIAANHMYQKVNGTSLTTVAQDKTEDPYLSLSYFRYNWTEILKRKGAAFIRAKARVSNDPSEAADLPDGTIRYPAERENPSPKRLEKVQSITGGLTYHDMNNMVELDEKEMDDFNNLINFLKQQGTEVILYLQPFSVTQCYYSFDKNLNPIILEVEEWLREYGQKEDIKVIGGYDARLFDISDADFIDYMHLDRNGTGVVWRSGCDLENMSFDEIER